MDNHTVEEKEDYELRARIKDINHRLTQIFADFIKGIRGIRNNN